MLWRIHFCSQTSTSTFRLVAEVPRRPRSGKRLRSSCAFIVRPFFSRYESTFFNHSPKENHETPKSRTNNQQELEVNLSAAIYLKDDQWLPWYLQLIRAYFLLHKFPATAKSVEESLYQSWQRECFASLPSRTNGVLF